MSREMKDLIVLTGDPTMRIAVMALLRRHQALQIRPIVPDAAADVYEHPKRDPGVYREADVFLRPFVTQYRYALVMFDREGCGAEKTQGREEIEREVEAKLSKNGWQNRCSAIVIDPELEAWVWADSPHVARVLGWGSDLKKLRKWLEKEGYLDPGEAKPRRPKEAMQQALRLTRTPRSASLYEELAKKVGLSRCTDNAFRRLCTVLRRWFPPD